MDDFFQKQERELKAKAKLKGIAIRQNELKLMKAARKSNVHGNILADEDTRELVRQIMRLFLQWGFPESAVESIVSFLPLYGWNDDIDFFGETLYLTVEFNKQDLASNRYDITRKPLQRTQAFGPDTEGRWHSLDGIELSRNELRIGGRHLYKSKKGFTPNRTCRFIGQYPRLRLAPDMNYVDIFVSAENNVPPAIQVPIGVQ